MKRHACMLVIGITAVCLLAGCGGGNDGAIGPPVNGMGSAIGRVNLGGQAPTGFQVLLDGAPAPVPVQPDGTFVLPNIPAGEHVVHVVGPDGMHGGRVEFTVAEGGTTEVPPIELTLGGQIVGIVTKRDENGLTPLAGVEVTARSDIMWIAGREGGLTVAPAQASGPMPLIYPPPEDSVSYSAVTGEDGSYAMKAVQPGSYLVTVVVPGLTGGQQFVWVEPGRTAVADFTLEPVVEPGVGTVQGTVYSVDSTGVEKPLEGATVQVSLDHPWRVPPPVRPIEVPVYLTLPAGPGAEGSAPPAGGSAGSEVGVAPVRPPDIYWQVFTTLTDHNGRYSLNVPSGRCTVSAWALGHESLTRSLVVQPRTVHTQDFRLRVVEVQPLPVPMPEGRLQGNRFGGPCCENRNTCRCRP